MSSLVPPRPRPIAPRHLTDDVKLAAPVALGIGLALWTPTDDGLTICPFRICTGGACPGCGLTRAAAALVKGDLASSWYYHPGAVLIALQVAAVWALAVGRRSGVVTWRPPRRWTSTMLVLNGLVLGTLWLVRWQLGQLEHVL